MIGASPRARPFAENEHMPINTLRGCRSVAAAIATVLITHGTTLAQEPTKDPIPAGTQPSNADDNARDDAITLPVVHVHGTQPAPNRTVLNPTVDYLFPAADAADVLQSIPGVSLGRIGGASHRPGSTSSTTAPSSMAAARTGWTRQPLICPWTGSTA